ncbi:hypothetical protein ACHAWF_017251, partial [Thalassiosira exigua]
ETAADKDRSRRELLEATRALEAALRSRASLERENHGLNARLRAEDGDRDAAFAKLQRQLSEAQSANAALSGQIAEEKANSDTSKEVNWKEASELRSAIQQRDDAIQDLEGRLAEGQDDASALRAELESLRLRSRGEKERPSSRRDRGPEEEEDASARLKKENAEMGQLVERQSRALKDATAELDRRKRECDEQRRIAKRRKEEIELLQSALEEEGIEKQATLVRNNSLNEQNQSKVATLEVELATMRERSDELTSALNDANEEVEDLRADVVFKEGKIRSLEEEMGEAADLLEAREPPPRSSEDGEQTSDGYARLRAEVEGILEERARIEADREERLSDLGTARDADVSRLEQEVGKVHLRLSREQDRAEQVQARLDAAEKENADLSRELREETSKNNKLHEVMDQLDSEEDRELDDTKEQLGKLRTEKEALANEVEDLRAKLDSAALDSEGDAEEAKEGKQEGTLDEEGERAKEEAKALKEELSALKEKVRAGKAELDRSTTEKDMVISDLRSELSSREMYAEDLKDELDALQLDVERGPSKRNYGMAIDPEWHEPDTISSLKVQVSTLDKKKRMVESELKSKIDARDATIANLVLSSSNQESNIFDLKSEVRRLEALVEEISSPKIEYTDLDTNRRKEMERLRERTHSLTIELKQTKRRLQSATEELECAKTCLSGDGAVMSEDLAGRLVILEQAQKILKAGNEENLRERDAAIANLLQSVQANEGIIAKLRADAASLKKKLEESLEENRRVQHESEIFAAQIIDQDEEFEGLNQRLKEKSGEIASLKRAIASATNDIRNIKNLERELAEMREERRRNLARIHELEEQNLEVKKEEGDKFEAEQLMLEIQKAKDEKEESEERLNKQIDSLRKSRNHAVEDFEAKLREREGQIASLEIELAELKERASEEDFDDIFLDDSKTGQSKKQLLEERDMLLVKIEALGEEIETLRASNESDEPSELQEMLVQSERLREELEKDRAVFGASKDKELDRLRKLLSEAREARSAREIEQAGLIKKLEVENDDIREEFSIRMQDKNAKIVALEQTLAAQEQVVGNMSSEMDQLQNGMEKISVQRRAEIEEMQQELMDYTSKATRLEREVTALSLKLDDKRLKHKAEVAKLKERITTLESETPLERILQRDEGGKTDDHTQELEEKNDHLKWLNSSLKDEIEKLKKKVEDFETKIDERQPSPQPSAKNNDKWRNVALQEQVAVLSQRVIELEEAAATVAQSSRRPPQSPIPNPSILHSPEVSSADAVNSRSASVPKSALRASTYEGNANEANNDILSKSDSTRPRSLSARGTPPPLPRPGGAKGSGVPPKSSSRFSLRKRGSKERQPSPG